jgi:hypothetical protein
MYRLCRRAPFGGASCHLGRGQTAGANLSLRSDCRIGLAQILVFRALNPEFLGDRATIQLLSGGRLHAPSQEVALPAGHGGDRQADPRETSERSL